MQSNNLKAARPLQGRESFFFEHNHHPSRIASGRAAAEFAVAEMITSNLFNFIMKPRAAGPRPTRE
jgi:hypothetical protein